jgi:superfamily II DNA helicase RecQ
LVQEKVHAELHRAWVPDCLWVFSLQVMGLSGRVRAHALTSLTSKEEAAQVMAALTAAAAAAAPAATSGSKAAAGKAKGGSSSAGAAAAAAAGGAAGGSEAMLLYVTPEKIVASKRLMAKLEKLHQVGLLCRKSVLVCWQAGSNLLLSV